MSDKLFDIPEGWEMVTYKDSNSIGWYNKHIRSREDGTRNNQF